MWISNEAESHHLKNCSKYTGSPASTRDHTTKLCSFVFFGSGHLLVPDNRELMQ